MIIGVGPHKSSHTATAVDAATNTAVASIRVAASPAGYRLLLGWAEQFDQRRWAVENTKDLGCRCAPAAPLPSVGSVHVTLSLHDHSCHSG